MSDDQNKQRSQADAEIEREIRKERKFNLADAIGRMAGPGALKGVSPIPRKEQAVAEIESWLRDHMPAGHGELQAVLVRWIEQSKLLLDNFEQPMVVLAAFCQQILNSDYLLQELVRETDTEWGREQGERPYFQTDGSLPNANDPYTLQSVRNALIGFLTQLETDNG